LSPCILSFPPPPFTFFFFFLIPDGTPLVTAELFSQILLPCDRWFEAQGLLVCGQRLAFLWVWFCWPITLGFSFFSNHPGDGGWFFIGKIRLRRSSKGIHDFPDLHISPPPSAYRPPHQPLDGAFSFEQPPPLPLDHSKNAFDPFTGLVLRLPSFPNHIAATWVLAIFGLLPLFEFFLGRVFWVALGRVGLTILS